MHRRVLILCLITLGGFLVLPAASAASDAQRIWIANGRTDSLAPVRSNVVSMAADGSDERNGPVLSGGVTAITGWRDSLYVGTSAGIVRTDFDGTVVQSTLTCASPWSMAVDPIAPALYAECDDNRSQHPLMRYPLAADGSLGTGTQIATLADLAESMFVQGAYLYLADTYPSNLGIVRVPLADPGSLQVPWYGDLQVQSIAGSTTELFMSATGGSTQRALVTSLGAPNWQSAITLPAVTNVPISDLALRDRLLYSASGYIYSDTTAVNVQSLTTLGAPTVLISWTDSVNHRQVLPIGIYPGNQPQEWYTDTSARALAAGAFTAPIRASSGLPATLASATPLICTVIGATVTPLVAGTCTITGEQVGNAAYLATTGSVSVPISVPISVPVTVPATATVAKPKFVNGALVTMIMVPGAGTLRQAGRVPRARKTTARPTVICSAKATPKAAGKVKLTCRLNKTGTARRKRGALTVTLTTIYTPTGGTAQTTTQKVKVASAKHG